MTGRIPNVLDEALRKMTHALRPWTIDFHIAQNDATVKGSGSHDKTGRHCLPLDPHGKLDIVKHAGFWLRDDNGDVTRAVEHVCWDGCMFPNAVMTQASTWSDVLRVMVKVRDAHGWEHSRRRQSQSAVAVDSRSRSRQSQSGVALKAGCRQ